MLPNLFVIGAAKAGTTSLQHYLAQHPEIFMAAVKEPNFFAFDGHVPAFNGPPTNGGGTLLDDRLRRERYELSVVDAPIYERLFARAGRRPVRGDCSPAYLHFPATAARIKAAVPDARIIAVLRNPVDRAYSKFLQMRRDRAEPLDSFDAALEAERARERDGWAPTWLYARRGFYFRQLEPYFRLFGAERIHIVLHEDLLRDPQSCMRSLFAFAGVTPDVRIDSSKHHNVTSELDLPRHDWLYDHLARPFLLSPSLQARVPARLAGLMRPLARRILLRREAKLTPAPLTMEIREALTARFAQDIGHLQRLIGRDLRHWLAVPTKARPLGTPTVAAFPRLHLAT